MEKELHTYHYHPEEITPGIMHIGVGNFHRTHQAYYTHLLLEEHGVKDWGIVGAMLLPQDEKLFHALKAQDFTYTLTVCGRDGNDEAYRIASIIDLIWGAKEPEKVFSCIADPRIRILTLTITEGGYSIEKSTGDFDLNNEDVCHALQEPHNPLTVFGFVAEGLRKRRKECNRPITVVVISEAGHHLTIVSSTESNGRIKKRCTKRMVHLFFAR